METMRHDMETHYVDLLSVIPHDPISHIRLAYQWDPIITVPLLARPRHDHRPCWIHA